jgi:4'-phosphopantetheinyl transferase
VLPDLTSIAPLNLGDLHIWICDIRKWIPERKEYLLALLNQDELKRLHRYRIPTKQDQFLCSRGLLKYVLSSYIASKPSEIILSIQSAGKPYLPDQAINFNLSHSGNLLVMGFGLYENIGLDIQEEYPISNLEIVLERYFNPEEQAYLSSLDPVIQQSEFFSIWSAKEAYLKALGEGFQVSPRAFSTLPAGESSQTYLLSDQKIPEHHQCWTIRDLALQSGFKGAVAVDGQLNRTVMLSFSPAGLKVFH